MYSWKKFKVTELGYGNNNTAYYVPITFNYKNMDDWAGRNGKLGLKSFFEDFVGEDNFDKVKAGNLTGDYKFRGVNIYTRDGKYCINFNFANSSGMIATSESAIYTTDEGVQFRFTTSNEFMGLNILIDKNIDLSGYNGTKFNLSTVNDGEGYLGYRVSSRNKSDYPAAGMQGGYLYVLDKSINDPPIMSGRVRLDKTKANAIADHIQLTWNSAVDDDLEFYNAYVENIYSDGRSETKHIYKGYETDYNYSTGYSVKYSKIRFFVEATDSENNVSNSIYSDTVHLIIPIKPVINGNDSDLGTKNNPFDISYIIEKATEDNTVTVTISIDDNVVKNEGAVSIGFKKTYHVDTRSLSFGTHKITIHAKDNDGDESKRIYTFTKSNKAPTISGYDTNLGEKRSAFSVKYTIHDDDNDSVTVVEKLNGSIRRTLSNVQKDTEISLNISESDIKSLKVGEKNTIEIVASDSRGATAFRRYYFTRNNLAPTISGTDKHLGALKDKFEYVFSISDVEKDTIYYSTYLDNKLLSKQVKAVDGKKYATVIEGMDMIKLEPGEHTFKIVAVDAQGSKSERIITFSRDVQTLIMMLKEPFATDVQSKKVLVAPGWDVAKGAECRVEVCNNGFDENPTWEDATAMTELNKAYVFQNDRKTASKWGVNIRLMIERKNAKTNSYITGIGGAFE